MTVKRQFDVVGSIIGLGQKSCMDEWVKRFDPSIENFRTAGELRKLGHIQSCRAQRLGCSASGNQRYAHFGERSGEIEETGFIRNGEQCTPDGTVHSYIAFLKLDCCA